MDKNTSGKPDAPQASFDDLNATETQIQFLLQQPGDFRERLQPDGSDAPGVQKFITVAHKSASMYIFNILKKIALQQEIPIINADKIWKFNNKSDKKVNYLDIILLNRNRDTLYINGRGPGREIKFCISNGLPQKSVFVLRDPRDMIISRYFSNKFSHPVLNETVRERKDALSTLDDDEGITWSIKDFEKTIAAYLCEWLDLINDRDVAFYTYEFMKTNTLLFFTSVFKHLNIEADTGNLTKIINEYNFQTLSKRKPDTEDVKSHYRKGIIGDWENHFKKHHEELFFSMPNCSKVFYGFGFDNPNL
jgi:hypothetical protein